jgi:hypothetical protein
MSELGAAVIGAIVGSALSAVPSWLLARRASAEVLERDRAQRRDEEKTAASRIFVKLAILANSILTLHNQVTEMDERADRDGRSSMRLFERISPLAGLESERYVDFDANDLAFLITAKNPNYVDDLILLARQHSAIVAGLREYSKLKTDLHFLMASKGRTARARDGVSKTVARVSPEEANLLAVKMDELDLFIHALKGQLSEYASNAHRIATAYGPIVHSYFGDRTLPSFELSQGRANKH